ncbi:hypothetical protein BpHYR1_001770 [Brachionus plicatilis]|uniref:Uncharacterized protein n=1 Tax=Brachionus plicatilis TaxID=10195 RepID=A0A3M7RLG0_BRAPC|nr:hypothetical protein BpHYR1_001770 [Brachionus plicatilis]
MNQKFQRLFTGSNPDNEIIFSWSRLFLFLLKYTGCQKKVRILVRIITSISLSFLSKNFKFGLYIPMYPLLRITEAQMALFVPFLLQLRVQYRHLNIRLFVRTKGKRILTALTGFRLAPNLANSSIYPKVFLIIQPYLNKRLVTHPQTVVKTFPQFDHILFIERLLFHACYVQLKMSHNFASLRIELLPMTQDKDYLGNSLKKKKKRKKVNYS